jgi:hypothetical protein
MKKTFTLVCPLCSSSNLVIDGLSMLDQRPFWRCRSCATRLAPVRPVVVTLIYGTVALLAIVGCLFVSVYLVWRAWLAPVPTPVAVPWFAFLMLAVGLVLAPYGLYVLYTEQRSRRPRWQTVLHPLPTASGQAAQIAQEEITRWKARAGQAPPAPHPGRRESTPTPPPATQIMRSDRTGPDRGSQADATS